MENMGAQHRGITIVRAKYVLTKDPEVAYCPNSDDPVDVFLEKAWQLGWLVQYDPDYYVRMAHEYQRLKESRDGLQKDLKAFERGIIFFPKLSIEQLKEQLDAVENYLKCLEVRAQIEGVSLE